MDPAHGKQEGVADHGHFARDGFHALCCFTRDRDCLRAKLSPGNVRSADGLLEFIKPRVERYRAWCKLFWMRGAAPPMLISSRLLLSVSAPPGSAPVILI